MIIQDHVTLTESSLGGGWAQSTTQEGRLILTSFFEEDPIYLAPLGGEGYVVEPNQTEELYNFLQTAQV